MEIKRGIQLQWSRTRATKRTKIVSDRFKGDEDSRRYYANTHTLEDVHETCLGDFEVIVDIDTIVRQLAGSAARNSSGRATAMSGLLKARKLTEKVLATVTKQYPIPEGHTELAPVEVTK